MGNKSANQQVTPTQLTDKELAVLKGSVNMSELAIRKLYDEFKQDCPSGRIDKNQFVKMYKEAMETEGKEDKRVDHVFAVFDRNGDGTIDFSEFVLAMSLYDRTNLDSKLEMSFEMIDTSADGTISYTEMVEFVRTALSLVDDPKAKEVNPEEFSTGIFKTLGAETNQRLTKKQFIDGCKKSPLLIDVFGST